MSESIGGVPRTTEPANENRPLIAEANSGAGVYGSSIADTSHRRKDATMSGPMNDKLADMLAGMSPVPRTNTDPTDESAEFSTADLRESANAVITNQHARRRVLAAADEIDRLRVELAAVTERAEKAEAEVDRLRALAFTELPVGDEMDYNTLPEVDY